MGGVGTFLLTLIHMGVGTLWLGGMAYSLFVVQPRLPRVLADPVRREEAYRELAAGNRWRVVGLIAVLAASGVGLAFVHTGRSAGWWLAIIVKAALLVASSALFWWVSWRGWPRRVFALPAELPAEQARFRRVALAMATLIGAAFVLGVAAAHTPWG
jgi:Flp pilus assembly protein TadB